MVNPERGAKESTGNPQVGVRLPEDMRDASKRASEAEERPEAWLIRRAYREWLASKGYLPR